ncbi:U-box domain-containing protein 21-like [Solanum verrucosum]|uniref:U-box domain-containing protein 21-like n=1 Tax=Solanum verrucosum TaxID=315347 RepID=UPI0020D0F055|nr:U-box domain-containing protein 21-like [Solanum verrucosum]
MIATWRKKRTEKRVTKRGFMKKTIKELVIPIQFTCPISLDLMKDPVTLSTGITYDRENIEKWINEGGNQTCPITNQHLKSYGSGISTIDPVLIPNHNIRKMIQQWCVENKEHGIDRIPTPRIPISSSDVSELLAKITNSSKLEMQDSRLCEELVTRVKNLASESDRNKCCFVTNGIGKVLSSAFLELSKGKNAKNASTEEVILSTLTLFLPLDVKSKTILGSISSLRCIAWFLKNGSLSSRRNAVLVLRDIMKMEEQEKVEILLNIEGALEGLVKLVKEPICPNTTKASLLTIYHMVNNSSSQSSRSRFVDVGLVELLIELLVDCDKSICEKALGVLDGILSYEEGVKRAYNYALSVPVLVKKLLRVSDLATEFSVSILWKICKNENNGDCGVFVEALQVGAFQKLLLMLQIGCSEITKEKASELLKLLNVHRDRAECVDSLDFKSLKRTF